MKLVIVSGLSGSGKSIALDTLEDCGYYCIDNLPVVLLQQFVDDVMAKAPATYAKTAIGIDARNRTEKLADFPDCIAFIRGKGIDCEVVYMEADENIILKRYSETRRKHPLTTESLPLREALDIERQMLHPVAVIADIVIDTSFTHYHQLRDLLKNRLGEKGKSSLSILFQSFGFKYGMPLDADFVFDARSLPNPYWVPQLRGLTGKHAEVVEFLQHETAVKEFLHDVGYFVGRWAPRFESDNRSYLTIAIGCTGGQHRSVYLVETLGQHFKTLTPNIIVRHRELRFPAS
ncbi:RNase adapter RapZ [Methylomonas sp. MED-D]|uniref:RNase adaptor protein RapZ n=1 Tax=Methylomonas koyamae TaxID=702114 RepID=A0A177NQC5_9GAMM|nr:RNase adapter RapZ [Methylomonas koyamae]NJA04524.1 RNase adapter RapZ [Methylococcaceae bacterium WWC4]OAI19240.1 RNase adaptor protein RapZ [Methylomonas koyamae]